MLCNSSILQICSPQGARGNELQKQKDWADDDRGHNTTSSYKDAKKNVKRDRINVVSDGDDSWSEPDVSAARKRMGLSAASLGRRTAVNEVSEIDTEKRK